MTASRTLLKACCLLLPGAGMAAPIVHVKYPVYGCARPEAVGAINNETSSPHSDPGWVAAAMGYGQCVRITPQSPWEPVGVGDGGLTLLAYRGTVGRPGSFYVPTSAIDFASAAPSDPPAGNAAAPDPPTGASVSPGSGPAADAVAEPPPSAAAPEAGDKQRASASDPQLAEVEAGVAKIDPAGASGGFPGLLLPVLALVGAGGTWLFWQRRRSLKRRRLLAAIRAEISANAHALQAKRAQTVLSDEYGTPDWSRWKAAKEYYFSTRIDPIVAEHGYRRLPAGSEGEIDDLIETAASRNAA